jgi:hypothetical protein
MKKTLLLLTFLAVNIANAQVTQQGKIMADLGIGFGIQHYQFTDLVTNISTPRDTSAAIEIPIGVEYGIRKWIGAGLMFNYASYINGDSASNEKARGVDILPVVFLHIPWSLNKIDLMGHIGYGYSRFAYDLNQNNNAQYRANGSLLNFGLKLRWLFSTDGHFGMQFWYSHSNYVYPKGVATDDSGSSHTRFISAALISSFLLCFLIEVRYYLRHYIIECFILSSICFEFLNNWHKPFKVNPL